MEHDHAIWRLACNRGMVDAEVYVLEPIVVKAGDEPAALAKAAQAQVGAALGLKVVNEQELEAYQARRTNRPPGCSQMTSPM